MTAAEMTNRLTILAATERGLIRDGDTARLAAVREQIAELTAARDAARAARAATVARRRATAEAADRRQATARAWVKAAR